MRAGRDRACGWEWVKFGTESGGCPVTREAEGQIHSLVPDVYSEKQKAPHQALGFTILRSFGHRHGRRQETGPERGRRGKRVCQGVGTEGELACQGLTMNCLWQENGCTWQGYF